MLLLLLYVQPPRGGGGGGAALGLFVYLFILFATVRTIPYPPHIGRTFAKLFEAPTMLAVTLGAATWFGYEFVTFFTHTRWGFLLRLVSGYPIGLMYQSFAALILQYYIPWGFTHLAAVLASLGVPSIIFSFLNSRSRVRNFLHFRVLDYFVLTFWAVFIVARLSFVYFQGGEYTRGACYSDFSFHLGLISSIAIGCNVNRTSLFRFETVICAGSPLAYPIFVNFHAAFLVSDCNMSFPNAMKWSAFVVGICFVYLIHALTLHFTNGDSWAAALSLPLWAFSGGLGFLEIADYGVNPAENAGNYIHDFNNHKVAFWFQSLTHIFHPQRSATFAMPLCYIAINALLCAVKMFEWRFFLFAALVVGITPQVQVHAFVALAIFSMVLAAVTLPFDHRWKRAAWGWAIFGIIANTIALPLWFPFLGRASGSDQFLAFRPIWRSHTYSPIGGFFSLWWKSLGVFGLIAIIFGHAVADLSQIRSYSASMAVFLVASVVMFQPWELDNCKIFQDGWIPLAVPFVAQYFTRVFRLAGNSVVRALVVGLFFSCLGSGLINLVIHEGYPGGIRQADTAMAGDWVAENSPVHAIFHAPDSHVLIPSACYAGRPLFQGYGGWTDSHGLTNLTRAVLIAPFDRGEKPEEAKKEKVGYQMKIEISPEEQHRFSQIEWWEPVMAYGNYQVWKLAYEGTTGSTKPAQTRRARSEEKSNRS
jgi:hypothetical protein